MCYLKQSPDFCFCFEKDKSGHVQIFKFSLREKKSGLVQILILPSEIKNWTKKMVHPHVWCPPPSQFMFFLGGVQTYISLCFFKLASSPQVNCAVSPQ